jgi:hypothetical protein
LREFSGYCCGTKRSSKSDLAIFQKLELPDVPGPFRLTRGNAGRTVCGDEVIGAMCQILDVRLRFGGVRWQIRAGKEPERRSALPTLERLYLLELLLGRFLVDMVSAEAIEEGEACKHKWIFYDLSLRRVMTSIEQ